MPRGDPEKAVHVLDLVQEFLDDGSRWIKGRFKDRDGNHCLVGALDHILRTYGILEIVPECRAFLAHRRGLAFRNPSVENVRRDAALKTLCVIILRCASQDAQNRGGYVAGGVRLGRPRRRVTGRSFAGGLGSAAVRRCPRSISLAIRERRAE